MTTPGLPLRHGDEGSAIRDLHRRLVAAGFSDVGELESFDSDTERAIRGFQASRRLVEDGVCARQTWAALIEADHRLGDRMLYLRAPMTRGDDVTDLQQRLGGLGFDAGYVDGTFGPDTEAALRNFQHNQAVTADGVVGPDTVLALGRLSGRRSGQKTVAEVREIERLRSASPGVAGRRLVIGEAGGLPTVVDSLAKRLRLDGAKVLTLHHPDLSTQARTANEWDGSVYVGLTLATDDWSVAYFSTDGFVSAGGESLAGRCESELSSSLGVDIPATGLRIPILRETRMPAVWCRIGPPPRVVETAPRVAKALHRAITRWCGRPLDDSDR
ncbi:MAG: peptidoglycan-binding domain-containing protein [Acidimicrobiales bacterium]|mgnify:CR=1 FL=1|jgi:N-acetylmuramoyl-L-alanine amidase